MQSEAVLAGLLLPGDYPLAKIGRYLAVAAMNWV
ncbi:hypothetical protein ABIA26_001839 [Sinorhizobium fredii]